MYKLTGKSVHMDSQRAILTGLDAETLFLSLIWEVTTVNACAKAAENYIKINR